MTPNQFKYRVHEVLSRVEWVDVLGYPPGENELRAPRGIEEVQAILKASSCRKAIQLEAMYVQFDGLSWPDVRNGYFINSIASDTYTQPDTGRYVLIHGSERRSVIEIGSGGGGELILLDCDSGEIVISVGARLDATMLSNSSELRVVADDIEELLEWFAADLDAFTQGEADGLHAYLI